MHPDRVECVCVGELRDDDACIGDVNQFQIAEVIPGYGMAALLVVMGIALLREACTSEVNSKSQDCADPCIDCA